MSYAGMVSERLKALLLDLPKSEQDREMAECESVASASGYLNLTPRTENPEQFSLDLFSDSGMRMLVERDGANERFALSSESPSELVGNLLPSDGHLD